MDKKNDNSGALNQTREKFSARSPDWFGRLQISGEVLQALIAGKPVKLAGWNREGKFGSFISLAVSVEKPKDEGAATDGFDWKAAEAAALRNQPPASAPMPVEDFNDEIPF